VILCDIGNSTFNFYATNSKKSISCYLNENLPKISKLNKLDKTNKESKNNLIYFASVNKKHTKKLQKNYKKQNIKTINISKMINFKTSYNGMGIDKKLVCISFKNKIIIDAGSVISVDVVKNNNHLGGYLFLGLRNNILSYKNISKKLKVNYNFSHNKYKHKLDKIPTNTKDALYLAVIKSLILFVKDLEHKYNLNIVITGGDGKFLSYYIKNAKYNKNLIFKSMQKVIHKTHKK
jgi:type III pantothenate kinase